MTIKSFLAAVVSVFLGAVVATFLWPQSPHLIAAFVFNLLYAVYLVSLFIVPALLVLKYRFSGGSHWSHIVGTVAFSAFCGYVFTLIVAALFAARVTFGETAIVRDGVLTMAGLLYCLKNGAEVGLLGGMCGLAFCLLTRMNRSPTSAP
jgi:hypothetical protein